MPIVSLRELTEDALAKRYAVPAINIVNDLTLESVLRAAVEERAGLHIIDPRRPPIFIAAVMPGHGGVTGNPGSPDESLSRGPDMEAVILGRVPARCRSFRECHPDA